MSLFGALRRSTRCASQPASWLRQRLLPGTQTQIQIHPQIHRRPLSSSPQLADWAMPDKRPRGKPRKGRPRLQTGGSTRGTTVVWGEFGLRMVDRDRHITSKQMRNGEDVVRRRLRGMNYRFLPRVNFGVPVYVKGNDMRMGTGKGAFSHYVVRLPAYRVAFEIQSDVHETVVRDALRLAGNKLPGVWEVVKKGDPPVIGITPLKPGITREDLFRPRRQPAASTVKTSGPAVPAPPPASSNIPP